MTEELLQIGEFAKLADTNLRTLRYYEELGLIRPAHRSEGKFRFYSKDQLKRIAAIKRLQGLGLALKEIQEIMVPTAGEKLGAMDHMRESLDKQIALVGERLQSLQREYDELKQARLKLEECKRCAHELGSSDCSPCAASSEAIYSILKSFV